MSILKFARRAVYMFYFRLLGLLLVYVALLICPASLARGDSHAIMLRDAVTHSNSVRSSVLDSDVVLYGRIADVSIGENAARWPDMRGRTYTVTVASVIKGSASHTVQFQQANISPDVSGFPAMLAKGYNVLLLLKRAHSGFLPVVPQCLIVLPYHVSVTTSNSETPYDRVIDLLLLTLRDPTFGPPVAELLLQMYDPRLIGRVRPFADSQNMIVSGCAISFLEFNQDVSAIPLGANKEAQAEASGTGSDAGLGLIFYFVPAAVPYLNPLLLNPLRNIRQYSMESLTNFNDPTSMPFLMIALQDPITRDNVAYLAYTTIAKCSGTKDINIADPDTYFGTKPKEDERLYKWWREELNGTRKDHLADIWSNPKTKTAKTGAVPDDALRLYSRDLSVRQAEMTSLESSTNQALVPYLLLTLQDPDSTLQYRAYCLLCKLDDIKTGVATSQQFSVSPAVYTSLLVKMWQKSLYAGISK